MAHEEGGSIQAMAVKRRRLYSAHFAINTMAECLSCPYDMTLNSLSCQAEFTELFKVRLELVFIVKSVTNAAHTVCYVHQIDINMLHSKDSHFNPG